MTWIKLDVTFFTNKKIIGLSYEAKLLYLEAMCYSSQHLTDGLIPSQMVPHLHIKRHQLASNLLLEHGLWDLDKEGNFRIVNYLEYQTSKAHVEKVKQATRNRVEAHRLKKLSNADVTALQNKSNADVTHLEQEQEVEQQVEQQLKDKRLVQTSFERFWDVYPRRDGKKKAVTFFEKALKVATIEVILEGVDRYIQFLKTTDQKIAMPATWLNGERWNDEVLASANSPKRKDHHQVPMPGAYGETMCGLCQQSWPCPKSQENPF